MKPNHGRTRVWRQCGKHFVDSVVDECNCYGGGSLMDMGGIHMHCRTPLCCVVGSLIGVQYCDCLLYTSDAADES